MKKIATLIALAVFAPNLTASASTMSEEEYRAALFAAMATAPIHITLEMCKKFNDGIKDFNSELEKGIGIGLYDTALPDKDPIGDIAKDTAKFFWKKTKKVACFLNHVYAGPFSDLLHMYENSVKPWEM